MIPRIFAKEECPLDGYDGFSIQILQNATDREWDDWQQGGLGQSGCVACAKLRQPPVARGKRTRRPAIESTPAAPAATYCPACTAARTRFGRAAVAFYGPGTPDLDFSMPDAALATLERDDLPSELLIWLILLPQTVRDRRTEELTKNLIRSSTSQS